MENQFNLEEYINGNCIDPSKDKLKIIASNRKQLELEEKQEKFFSKDNRKFVEDFPYLTKLLGVLKVVHSALEAILELKESGKKVVDEKGKKLLQQLRSIFRKLYDANDSKHQTGISVLMLRFARLVNIISESLAIEIIILMMEILKQILKILIDTIENSSEEDLMYYEMWAKLASDSFAKIAKNPTFQAALAVAASSSVFVIGANVGLTLLGFTVSGVQAGTIAATWMSAIGVVGKGSLFAALQSAGVVGFGAAATGGIAIVGGLVGLGVFAVVKIATMETEENVKVIVLSPEKEVKSEVEVNFSSKMKLKYLLIESLPQNVFIPDDVNQVGVKLNENGKSIPIPYSSLKKKATYVFGFKLFGPKSFLEVFKKTSSHTSLELPFYLQRTGKDTWKIVENQPTSWL